MEIRERSNHCKVKEKLEGENYIQFYVRFVTP